MSLARNLSVVVAGCWFLVGCSGSSSGSTSSGTGSTGGSSTSSSGSSGAVTAARACGDFASATCTLISSCSQGFLIARGYGEYTNCLSAVTATCTTDLAAPQNAQKPANVEACAQAMGSEDCTDFFDNNVPSACAAPAGPLGLGATCYADGQCGSAFCAVPTSGAVCGTCQPPPQSGTSCATTSCGKYGLVCSSHSLVCLVPAIDGGSCNDVNGCQAGFDCLGLDAGGLPGICQPKAVRQGFACDPKHFTNTTCNNRLGLFCNSVKLCEKIQIFDAGASCGEIDAGPSKCADGGAQCIVEEQIDCFNGGACVDDNGLSASCTSAVAEGATCDLAAGPACAPPSTCVPSSSSVTSGACSVPSATLCQ